MNVLLDTCAIIWAVAEPEKLSLQARSVLQQPDTAVFVSPISCAELACLQDRGRIELDAHWSIWFERYITMNDWLVVDISLRIIRDAFALPPPFHDDPADRIIVATARMGALTLITGDQKLINYAHVQTL